MLFATLLLSAFGAILLQEFIPPVAWLQGARVMLMPVVLFYGAMALPYPQMLALAFLSGLMWDLNIAHFVDGAFEVVPGWSIVLFALLCLMAHGLRPIFLRGRWEVHCLASGLGVAVLVATELVFITLRRESVAINEVAWWRIGGAGALALLVAPFVYFIFHLAWKLTGLGGWERSMDSLKLHKN